MSKDPEYYFRKSEKNKVTDVSKMPKPSGAPTLVISEAHQTQQDQPKATKQKMQSTNCKKSKTKAKPIYDRKVGDIVVSFA